jgi:recombination endonuclease VII
MDYKNKRGPKPHTHCKFGHELTPENTVQVYAKNGTKNGRRCKQCIAEDQKAYREANPDRMYRHRIVHQMRTRYGINSLEERDAILAAQGGACAICGTTDCSWRKGFQKAWHIDHKHDGTANHRGIICSGCNHTIGRANDNPELLDKMAAYLRSFQGAS